MSSGSGEVSATQEWNDSPPRQQPLRVLCTGMSRREITLVAFRKADLASLHCRSWVTPDLPCVLHHDQDQSRSSDAWPALPTAAAPRGGAGHHSVHQKITECPSLVSKRRARTAASCLQTLSRVNPCSVPREEAPCFGAIQHTECSQ